MIKEVLQQLEPLDAQIDALCSSIDDAEMANTTTHAAELAELSAQENMLLQRCTSLSDPMTTRTFFICYSSYKNK